MMTADDVIESYVRAVASYLPRRKRDDVAFELHNFLIWAVTGALVFSKIDRSPLQWIGGVFVWFALAAWLRRRQTGERLHWRPDWDPYPEAANRFFVLLPGLVTLVFPFAMYLAPRAWWETATFGRGVARPRSRSESTCR